MNESEETEEMQVLPNCRPISSGRPGDVRYTIPLPHPTTTHVIKARFLSKSRLCILSNRNLIRVL